MSDIFQIDEFSADELKRIRDKIDSVRGPGVTNGRDFILINPPPSNGGSAGDDGGDEIKGQGELQGQVFMMRSNNVPGWDFEIFIPPK